MPLIRLTVELFQDLKSAWAEELLTYEEVIGDYARPSMQHAEEIINGKITDRNYAVYALVIDGNFHCLLHATTAELPSTVGTTLKVLWVLLAPRFDYEDITPENLAEIASGLIFGCLELSEGEMRSDQVKIHINTIADRRFLAGVAFTLKDERHLKRAQLVGNWLHLSK